jgi:hypothetical protein
MKTLLLALWLAASVYAVAIANESRHSAIVDMPHVITLTHASPETWDTLPPVQPNEGPTLTDTGVPLVFGRVGRVEQRCDVDPADQSRNSLSLVEFFDADHS